MTYYFAVYCETEGIWVYFTDTVAEPATVECPNDAAHTLRRNGGYGDSLRIYKTEDS